MRHRCYENRRIEGFVLLYTLWLLLGGVVLFATVSGLTLGRSRSAAATANGCGRRLRSNLQHTKLCSGWS